MKKLILAVAVMLSAACSSSQRDVCAEIKGSPLPFIQTAFGMETQAVLDETRTEGICEEGGMKLTLISYDSQKIVLFQGGVGPEKSTRSAETVLSNYKVKLLVFSGIAGAVDQSLPIGDTLVPSVWSNYDGGQLNMTSDMVAKAKSFGYKTDVKGISSDHFVFNFAEIPIQNVSIVDMESFFVAKAAMKYDVPFVAVRSVSDKADGTTSRGYYGVAAKASAVATVRLVSVISH